MLVASGLIVQMVFWMRRHGRTFKKDLEADMARNARTANWWGLLVVVALAVGRETAEDGRISLRSRRRAERHRQLCRSCSCSASARAFATFWLLQQGSRVLSWRTFFRVSEILLLLLAGALLVSGVERLIAPRRAAAADRSCLGHVGGSRRFGPNRRTRRVVHRLPRASGAAAADCAGALLGDRMVLPASFEAAVAAAAATRRTRPARRAQLSVRKTVMRPRLGRGRSAPR